MRQMETDRSRPRALALMHNAPAKPLATFSVPAFISYARDSSIIKHQEALGEDHRIGVAFLALGFWFRTVLRASIKAPINEWLVPFRGIGVLPGWT
jgi:hypothetical protein